MDALNYMRKYLVNIYQLMMYKLNSKKLLFTICFLFVVGIIISFFIFSEGSDRNKLIDDVSDGENTKAIPTDSVLYEDQYPLHTGITATIFWVGEGKSLDNAGISNVSSAWDGKWQRNFGGIDSPNKRKGFLPADFTPKENPFYVALPYNDLENGLRKSNSSNIYWLDDASDNKNKTILKNRWVMMSSGNNICYGQWEDVGPFETDDVDYVFGNSLPKNLFGKKAGIDLSPALAECLNVNGVGTVNWKFIDEVHVPSGPWKEIVTSK